jgi:hypothetical protein
LLPEWSLKINKRQRIQKLKPFKINRDSQNENTNGLRMI